MTMNHSAFVLDHDSFDSELRPILFSALESGDVVALGGWIDANRDALVDPYEGNKLPQNWRALLPAPSVQVYGDFALTKFYNPTLSLGLDEDWEELGELLEQYGLDDAVIVGTPLGPDNDHLFDPGGCGSYFQTPTEVRANSSKVERLLVQTSTLNLQLGPVAAMLRAAMLAGQGLYITF
jgi:hypothetical protein